MARQNNFLTAADFMNYEYCPRIVYFIHVLKQPQTKGSKQKKGLEKDFSFKKTKRTKIVKNYFFPSNLEKFYNVPLEDGDFATKVDCVAIDKPNNLAFPIQLKYSFQPNKIYRTQKLQLLLEAFLIEKLLKYSVSYGYIKYLKSNSLVKVWLEDKKMMFEIANQVKEIIRDETFPKATKYKKRCIDCCYRRMCY